jgi:hypothetical protein
MGPHRQARGLLARRIKGEGLLPQRGNHEIGRFSCQGGVLFEGYIETISFYEKHVFCKEGPEFVEASISHVKMVRDLQPISGAEG